MSNKTDARREQFISREQIRDAIDLLSNIELNFDKINNTEDNSFSLGRKIVQDSENASLFSKANVIPFFWTFLANFLVIVLGMVAAWILIDINYLSEREAASPKLDVEYAYFYELGSVEKEPIAEMIHQLAQFEKYGEFVMQSMGRHDLRHIDAMGAEIGASDARKLASIVSMYRDFLVEKKAELARKMLTIPDMQTSELRMQGRAVLANIEGLDNDGIRAKLVDQIMVDQNDIDNLQTALDSVNHMLAKIENRVFTKLSILNTGGRAGLVRPRGFIEYSNKCYAMVRVEAPPQDDRPIAVPTYVVNSDAGGVTHTVGKIESDTMAQYWYEIRGSVKDASSCAGLREEASIAENSERQACPDGDEAIAYIFDHKKQAISQKVDCNGPIL